VDELNAVCCVVSHASARRTMDHRRAVDEDRITVLETMLRETSEAATECERKYEEVGNGTAACFHSFSTNTILSSYCLHSSAIFHACFPKLLKFNLIIIIIIDAQYTPCPEKRGQSILIITLTNLDTVSQFLAGIILILQCTKTLENLSQHCNVVAWR